MNTANITFFIAALCIAVTIAAGVVDLASGLMAQIEQAFVIVR